MSRVTDAYSLDPYGMKYSGTSGLERNIRMPGTNQKTRQKQVAVWGTQSTPHLSLVLALTAVVLLQQYPKCMLSDGDVHGIASKRG